MRPRITDKSCTGSRASCLFFSRLKSRTSDIRVTQCKEFEHMWHVVDPSKESHHEKCVFKKLITGNSSLDPLDHKVYLNNV